MENTNTRLTYYDSLTGLPKLRVFENTLNELIMMSSGMLDGGLDKIALVYLDINNFKYIKETFDDKVSDEVVKYVAEYLSHKVKGNTLISRATKDKFALLFNHVDSEAILYDTIDEIINSGCNIGTGDNVIYITMSAGIALFPEHGSEMKALMQKAEIALAYAKKTGIDIKIYSEELQKKIISQVQMINELQSAIDQEAFTLYYQPEYNLKTNNLVGVEALIRWFHPEKGFISPDIFIQVAEQSKQIFELERWIVHTALQQKKQWENDGLDFMELSINLSSKTLESEKNFRKLEQIISSYDVNYTKIIFEITETIMIKHVEKAIQRLKRLRNYGIRIALDDFGTGYSSLAHIMKLPIDIIKVDRSFISKVPFGVEETAITRNIIALAHSLNYRVVAEGIETSDQLNFLKKIACETGQGYLLCKPLPEEKLREVMNIKFSIVC